MRFDIITAFPESFSYLDSSLFYQAKKGKLLEIKLWPLRDFASDRHRTIDDRPFGGGPGMVLKIEPIYTALQAVKKVKRTNKRKIILTSLAGKPFTQKLARQLSQEKQLVIICGHYEGVDERVKKLVDLEISIGPYVLTGGELPAMVIVDVVSRYLPGFLHNPESLEERRIEKILSFRNRLSSRPSGEPQPRLSAVLFSADTSKPSQNRLRSVSWQKNFSITSIPVYTRPRVFKIGKKSYKVPAVLLSGDHKKIIAWQKKHAREIVFS